MSYDSYQDTHDHSIKVYGYIQDMMAKLNIRGVTHDASKLGKIEKPYFDEYTPKLKEAEYGSEKYKQFLSELQVALKHHYANNQHHPEHFENGIDGMSLIDIIELFCDWKSATERTKDGDLDKSIEFNKTRFHMSEQLVNIFKNTKKEMGW
jgi:hypothetical protein